jgi:toxin ParE1/3/4
MNSRRVIIEPDALQDIDNQFNYLAKENPEAARRFLTAWQDTFNELAVMPNMGSPVDIGTPRYPGMRMWPIRGFRKIVVFYISSTNDINILRVLHTAQNIEDIFKHMNEE